VPYGPINKTTFTPTKDGGVIRRMPNLVKFRERPDAMLVMSLEEYDDVTGTAKKAAILEKDVVGRNEPITHVARRGRTSGFAGSQRCRRSGLHRHALNGKPERQIIEELGDLIYHDPETKSWQTADDYLSGNVRSKLAFARKPGRSMPRSVVSCVQSSPRTCCPATSTPI